jgi:dipeptidase E
MTLCFISGGQLREFHDVLVPYVKGADKALVIPFATEETKYGRWLESTDLFFSALGIGDTDILSIQDSSEHSIAKIESSRILFFTGGRPEKLIAQINEKRLLDVIKKYDGLIIGYSAGALALSHDCIITKDDDYPETHLIQGMGIVDFSIEVHYTPVVD